MTVDESSSQDATLIDDDLVAALGFEPVGTVDSANGHVDEEETVDTTDSAVDRGSDDVGSVDGVEVVEEGEPVSKSFFDLDTSVDEAEPNEAVVDEAVVDETDVAIIELDAEVDEIAVDEIAVDEIAVDEIAVDEIADGEAADGESISGAAVIDLDQIDADVDPESNEATDEASLPDADLDLADADSVFADAEEIDDRVEHGATETLPLADSIDLEAPLVADFAPDEVDAEVALDAAPAVVAAPAATKTKRRRRLRARKSRRVIRHIDPWSVLTFSVLFHMVVFAALLLSSVLVWNAAIASGMVENIESFIQELGDYETFEINADVMFKAAIVIAGMLTLASSVMVVLLTVVFNLISDLVGGIRVTVIEEETVRVPIDKKRSNRSR